jgi:gamma-glutamyltranspeptidase/glutathione hydrolase
MESVRTWRPVIMGSGGAVVSNHPLATRAGYEVLRAGGRAADAAVAVAVTLAVVEPNMSGVGGDGFFLVWDARSRAGTVIHACGHAPAAATPERYAGGIPAIGPLAVSVPGLVAGWEAARARFGTRPRAELYAAAIEHARQGYPATRRFCDFARLHAENLARDPACASTYLPGGALPALGTTIRNAALARTLEALAADGPDALYAGELGRSVARTLADRGGLIAASDLAEHRADARPPISTAYRGLTVLQAGPTSMGFSLLQELAVVAQFDLPAMGHLSADSLHLLIEAKKLAFTDRERYAGDPRFVGAPFGRLLDPTYAKELAGRIDMQRAGVSPPFRPDPSADTTYFAVVDRDGSAVSAIQSLGAAFGSCVMDPHTGILLNNRMTWWHLEPGHPNRLAPGKRVRQTMNTPLALQDGAVRYVWGTPGGDSQVQVNLQNFTAMVDFGLDPQQAVEAARWDHFQPGTGSVFPHAMSDELVVEDRVPAAVRDALRARGHRVRLIGPLDGPCSAEVIERRPDGLLLCGSDPRRDGWAAAF